MKQAQNNKNAANSECFLERGERLHKVAQEILELSVDHGLTVHELMVIIDIAKEKALNYSKVISSL